MKIFRIFLLLNLTTLYGLMFIGGLVRSTGSGMGCPDWPKCFGKWVPPTQESELPSNYKEIYAEHGYSSQPFNATKTWIEYVNRLFGVLTGLFMIGSFFSSIPLRRINKKLFWLSGLGLLLTMYQGWLGSKVVATNLAHKMVTVHFLLAILILGVYTLCYVVFNNIDKLNQIKHLNKKLLALSIILLSVLVVQIGLGTIVRTTIDEYILNTGSPDRYAWIDNAGNILLSHRLTSGLITLITVVFFWLRNKENKLLSSEFLLSEKIFFASVLSQIIIGGILFGFGLPAWAQPIHILISTIMFGALLHKILTDLLSTPLLAQKKQLNFTA